ncbi:MAG: hypothetical protein PHW54_06885, partial [Candidatus Omnitrophica bacterium]|nr:hypothetical protein [Candidatus Omnitrophota bacterium]
KMSYTFKNDLHIYNLENDRWEKTDNILSVSDMAGLVIEAPELICQPRRARRFNQSAFLLFTIIGALILSAFQQDSGAALFMAFVFPVMGLIYSSNPEDNSKLKNTAVSLYEMINKIKLGRSESNIIKAFQPGLLDRRYLRTGVWLTDAQIGEFILIRDDFDNRYTWIRGFEVIEAFREKKNFIYNVCVRKLRRHLSGEKEGFLLEEPLSKETGSLPKKPNARLDGQLELKPVQADSVKHVSLSSIREELDIKEENILWDLLATHLHDGLQLLPEGCSVYLPQRRIRKEDGEFSVEIRVLEDNAVLAQSMKWNAQGNNLILLNTVNSQELVVTVLFKNIAKRDTIWVGDTEYALLQGEPGANQVFLKKIEDINKEEAYALNKDKQGRVILILNELESNPDVRMFYGNDYFEGRNKLRIALEHEDAGIAFLEAGDFACEIAAYRLALSHLPQAKDYETHKQRIEGRLKKAIEAARARSAKTGYGGLGNLSSNNVEEIKALITNRQYRQVNGVKRLIREIDGVPVNVYILTGQITRAPPKGFIWERLNNGELEIYFSSLKCYKQYAKINSALQFFACHGIAEIEFLEKGFSPQDAHTAAWEKAAQRFPGPAHEIKTFLHKRVWIDEGRIMVSLQSYIAKEVKGITRYTLTEGAVSHKTIWESFRAEDHIIDAELKDRLMVIANIELISQAVKSITGQGRTLSEEERAKIIGVVQEIRSSIVKPSGRLRVGEKIIAQILSKATEEMVVTVEEPHKEVLELLKNTQDNLALRKQANEKIIEGRRLALKELRDMAREGNKDISRRISAVIDLINKGGLSKAQGPMLGIINLGLIKGEPEYTPIKRLLFAALRITDKNEALEVMNMVSQRLKGIEFLYEFMVKFRDDLIEKELKLNTPVDRQALLKDTFLFFWKTAKSEFGELLNHSSKQRAIWWARVYQASTISMNINNPKNRKERIPNPVFRGISRYIYFLEFSFIEDILKRERIGIKTR